MTNLVALPNEILHNIFQLVDPVDLAHLSISSRGLNNNITSDVQLYKAVYCQILDEPLKELPGQIDYEAQMKDLVRYRYILTSPASAEEKAIHLPFISNFTTTLLRNASSLDGQNLTLLNSHFGSSSHLSTINIEAFLSQSSTYNRASLSPAKVHAYTHASLVPLSLRQASAKLHVLYGKPNLLPRPSHFNSPYPYAVSMVYDLRNYTEAALWGPYIGDWMASVDWEKLEAVMLVLAYNIDSFRQKIGDRLLPRGLIWREGWKGASPWSYRSVEIVDDIDEKEEEAEKNGRTKVDDPYNIEGTWVRVVCFLDFHDLFAYNFTSPTIPLGTPRPPLQTTEAIRLITMELRVTHTEPPGLDDGQSHPIVHFEGVSRSLHSAWDANASSNIRGNVRMTKEGEVRWQSTSVYSGEDRWRSEGIQIGGIQSARGVLGHWFDKDHDVHGPAGPTAFFKVSDQIKKSAPVSSDDLETDDEIPHLLEVDVEDEEDVMNASDVDADDEEQVELFNADEEEQIAVYIGQLAQSGGHDGEHGLVLGHGAGILHNIHARVHGYIGEDGPLDL